MKKLLIIAIAFMIFGCQTGAGIKDDKKASIMPVDLSGILPLDTTVSGVVDVTGNVYVPKGVTLTIMPGTTLIMHKSESTKIEPIFLSSNTEILVRGSIIAKGTPEKEITFISDQDNPGMTDYAGVILQESDVALFQNCVFIGAQTAILSFESDLKVAACEFETCQNAISSIGSRVDIIKSIVRNCDNGMYMHRGTVGNISGCVFSDCEEDGLFIDKKSSITVYSNIFKNNLWGISTIEYEGTFMDNNVFEGNKINVRGLNY